MQVRINHIERPALYVASDPLLAIRTFFRLTLISAIWYSEFSFICKGFMISPSLEEFKKKAKQGNLIPVYREILADMETPVSAFRKIDDGKYSFLLESVEGGEKWARYSFLGSRPEVVVRSFGGPSSVRHGRKETRTFEHDPSSLSATSSPNTGRCRPLAPAVLRRGVASWAMTWSGSSSGCRTGRAGADTPDVLFMITDTLVIFDIVTHRIKVVSNAHVNGGSSRPRTGRPSRRSTGS